MALYVNTNVSSLGAQRNLSDVTNRLNSSFEKLSSGSRINSARDDAAGLQISDRLTTQVTGLNQATRNANDGISIAQIAEGALGEVTSNVQRMRQLVVQGGNGTLSQADRNALGEEFKKLMNVNESISERTAFGDQKLLDGSAPDGGFSIQTGAYAGERDTITTGNSTLKGLIGSVVNDDATITASTADFTTASASNLSLYGAAGDLVEAYLAVTTVNATQAIVDIFGTDGSNVGTLSKLADNSLVSLDFDKISEILSNKLTDNQSGVASLVLAASAALTNDLVAAFSAAGVSTLLDSTTGFSEDQLTVMRDFATDQLMDAMSDIVGQVGSMRATLGSEQNGMSSVIRNNQAAIVNVSDARSRVMDTDFAAETAELTRNQIIQQASNTILAQANQLPQAALSLLR
jgi:flagellin